MDKYSALHTGKVIKQLRKAKKLSQEGLALRSSLDRSYISTLERERKKPSLNTIVALAIGLGIQVSEIIIAIEEQPENHWLQEILEIQDPEY